MAVVQLDWRSQRLSDVKTVDMQVEGEKERAKEQGGERDEVQGIGLPCV